MPTLITLPSRPFHFRRRISLLGSGLCSLLALVACAPKEHVFQGAGGSGGGGGGGTGTGGAGGGTGTGGAKPCETSDPNCECKDEEVVARDADGDLEGSALCVAAPGDDCDDADALFIKNVCGGCAKDLVGKVGDKCGACGALACVGKASLECDPPAPPPLQCAGNTIQVCNGAAWVDKMACSDITPACYQGACVQCVPGSFKCGTYKNLPVVIKCLPNAQWEPSWSVSCTSTQSCHSSTGKCVSLFHPRDLDFEVPALLKAQEVPDASDAPGLRTRDLLDLATGFAFG